MTRDLILGIALSVIIHLAVFFGDKLIADKPVVQIAQDDTPKIELMAMPKMDEIEPEIVETTEEVKPLDLAPPMQADVPQLAPPDAFVQKIQPPPPEGITVSATMNVIPEFRDPNQWQGMRVFDLSMLDQIPVPRLQQPPQYPFEMRRAGIAGEVTVEFIVDPTGNVVNAHAVKSTQREFEANAVAAVAKWKFKAGRRGGRDVPTRMQVPIVFSLNNE